MTDDALVINVVYVIVLEWSYQAVNYFWSLKKLYKITGHFQDTSKNVSIFIVLWVEAFSQYYS